MENEKPDAEAQASETTVCGQCAVVIGDAESLHTVTAGEPGRIHTKCYDNWFAAHIGTRPICAACGGRITHDQETTSTAKGEIHEFCTDDAA